MNYQRVGRGALVALLVAVPMLALAEKPAEKSAAPRVPLADFAQHAQVRDPILSPDGEHLAVSMRDPQSGAQSLLVYAIADMKQPTAMLRMPKYEVPVSIKWVSNTRLIVEKGREFGTVDEPQLTGEIIATDLDGKHQDYLYGYQGFEQSRRGSVRGSDQGAGFYDGQPTPANGHFYLRTYRATRAATNQSSLYEVDAVRNTRHLIGDIGVDGMQFLVNHDGQARYAYGIDNSFQYEIYHRQGNGWAPMTASETGRTFTPIAFTPDGKSIYANYAAGAGPTALVEQTETGGQRKVLAQDDFSSIGYVQWTAMPRTPFATSPATGLPRITYIKPITATSKLHMALAQKFPGQSVNFLNFSQDGKKLLFSLSSDRNPGSYFLIDTTTFKVQKLFDAAPQLDTARMPERRPVRFTASDGMELDGILTVPNGHEASNLPMVLLPHGGPIGIEDTWYYDNDAAFLASLGYLVLQVNYRGSSGRGAGFRKAAYRQWGTRVQQDLIDGVTWAINQHYADAKRICVYGASFGGYAAMMTTIRAPGMFKCAVGYAGIYDLKMMYDKGDIRESKTGRSYLTQVIGKDDAELAANSPDKLADKIDVPVLLVHGEDDQRAPFAQAQAMRAALDAAHKPYEWLAKPGEGHGFYSEKNNIEFYTTLQAFLDKHLGPGGS